MEVEKEITTKEGRKLRVWVEDHGSSTTLFYIHGSMASHRQFQLLRDAMNDKSSNDAMNDKSSNDAMNDKSSNVVAYDALGCGESEKPNGDFYGTEDLADDALYIFREFATKHNILISHSYGTCVAARLVAKYQKLNDYDDDDAEKEKKKNSSSGMNNNNDEDNNNNNNNNNTNNNNNNTTNNNNNTNTNNNNTTTTTTNTNNNNKPLIEAVILLGTELSRPDGGHPIFALPSLLLDCLQGYLSKQFVKVAFSPATSEDLKLKCLKDSDTNSMYVCKSFYRYYYYYYYYCGFQWAREEEWRALGRVPVLVLQGKDDLITGVEGAQALYYTHFKANPLSAMVVVGDAGHQIMQEKPNECSSAIIEFLSRLEFKNPAFNVM